MIKQILFLIAVLFSGTSLLAQDIMTLKDGRTFKVTVVEVGKKEVTYRKFDNPKGPLYRAEIRDISKIDYESGAVDDFGSPKKESSSVGSNSSGAPTYSTDLLGRNIISIETFSLLFQSVHLSYEHIFGKNGKLGIRVPISISMMDPNAGANAFGNARNLYYSGAEMKYYPLGQGVFRFFTGPALRVGAKRTYNSYWDVQTGGYISETLNSNYFAFLVKFGFLYNPVPELSIGMDFGLGTMRYFYNIPSGNAAGAAGDFQFTLGYRF